MLRAEAAPLTVETVLRHPPSRQARQCRCERPVFAGGQQLRHNLKTSEPAGGVIGIRSVWRMRLRIVVLAPTGRLRVGYPRGSVLRRNVLKHTWRRIESAEAVPIVLRGSFQGWRRHIAVEREHVLPRTRISDVGARGLGSPRASAAAALLQPGHAVHHHMACVLDPDHAVSPQSRQLPAHSLVRNSKEIRDFGTRQRQIEGR